MKTAWRVGVLAVLVVAALLLAARLRPERMVNRLEKGSGHAARQFELIGMLPPALAETSGLVVSRTHPGVLWSHNDSGDGPNLYAIDATGKLLATFQLKAEARDWEDMDSGPCPDGGGTASDSPSPLVCLYLGDIGDNGRVRETLTIYVVAEPSVARAGGSPQSVETRSFRYRYPDGPDDAEALAVLPDGDMTIVTKGRSGTIGFFRLSRAAIARAIISGEVLTAEYQGDSGIKPDAAISRLATGAAVSPDGTTLAVRTYYEVYFFRATRDGDTVRWSGPGEPCFLGKAEPQGEAIDYLDQELLLLTSERSSNASAVIHRVRC